MDSRGNRAWGLAGIMDVSSVIVGGIIGGMSRDICKVRRPLDRTRLFLAVFSCWFVTKPFQAFLQIYVIFINRIRQIPLRFSTRVIRMFLSNLRNYWDITHFRSLVNSGTFSINQSDF